MVLPIATALIVGAYVVLSKDAQPKRPAATPGESFQHPAELKRRTFGRCDVSLRDPLTTPADRASNKPSVQLCTPLISAANSFRFSTLPRKMTFTMPPYAYLRMAIRLGRTIISDFLTDIATTSVRYPAPQRSIVPNQSSLDQNASLLHRLDVPHRRIDFQIFACFSAVVLATAQPSISTELPQGSDCSQLQRCPPGSPLDALHRPTDGRYRS